MAIISKAGAAVAAAALLVAGACASEDDNGGDEAANDETTTTAAAGETTTTAAPTTEAPATPDVAGEPDEVDDVTLDSCDNSGVDLATARGTITNDSSEPSNYLLEFSVVDGAGAVVGSGFGAVNNVQPGGSVPWEGTSDVALPEGGTCQLASVERFSA